MTEQDANIYLEENYKYYFFNVNVTINNTLFKDIFVNYMAVIKESNDIFITNDYKIEIGFDNTDSIFIKNLKSVKKEGNLKSLDLTKLYHQINEDVRWNFPKDEKLNEFIKKNKFEEDIKTKTPILSQKVHYQSFYKSTKSHEILKGGISISEDCSRDMSGTAGAFFRMKSKEVYMITNSHVINFSRCVVKDIVHPSRPDAKINNINSQKIGEVYWYSKESDKTMDAAIIKIDSNFIDKIKHTRCKEIKFKGIDKPKIGDLVRKCGRSSGLTCGYVRSINCIVNVNSVYNKGKKPYPKLYKNQLLTTEMSANGDSGSVLVNAQNKIVGLLFAGSIGETFATDINNILKKASEEVFKNDSIEKFI